MIICVSRTIMPSVDVNNATDAVKKMSLVHKLIIVQYELRENTINDTNSIIINNKPI